jgi:hypothetical protein
VKLPPIQARADGCLSDLRLDRLMAGELGDGDAEARGHLQGCPACAARFAILEDERARFVTAMPPLRAAREVRDEASVTAPASARRGIAGAAPRPQRWLWPSMGAALAAAAAATLLFRATPPAQDVPDAGAGIIQVPGPAPAPAGAGETRAKGAAHIGFYVKRGASVVRGGPGEVLHPGDTLQLVYTATSASFLAVLSVDGAREVSVYFPDGSRAAPVEAGQEVQLPASTVLDATLGTETLHALFCDAPIDLAPVRAAFEAAPAAPPIPAGCAVDRVQVEKRAP